LVSKSELLAITQIEQRSRKILDRCSVPFEIANAHFVPVKLLPTIQAQIEELKKEFFERVDSFISRFEKIREEIQTKYTEFYDKCLKNYYPPNPSELRKYYIFEYYVFKISGLGSIEQSDTTELTNRHELLAKMQEKMKTELDEFINMYVSAMRQETTKFCDLMAARISGKPYGDETEVKKLTPRSIGSFRKYVDRFRDMNIFGDGEIEKLLIDFQQTYLDSGVGPKHFESTNVKSSVEKALETIRNKAAGEGQLSRKIIL
jgi:hypothetical protein